MAKSKTQNKSKGKNLEKSFSAKFQSPAQVSQSDFLTPKARQVFTKLKQAFIEALILYH